MTLDVAQGHLNQWQQKAEQAEARIIGLEKELSDCKKMEGVSYQLRESLRDEISAANARIAELTENQLSPLELAKLYCKLKEQEQRTEQAEAQNKRLRNYGNCDKWRECWGMPEEVPGMEICYRWENAKSGFVQDVILAENKRMREALEEIKSVKLKGVRLLDESFCLAPLAQRGGISLCLPNLLPSVAVVYILLGLVGPLAVVRLMRFGPVPVTIPRLVIRQLRATNVPAPCL